MPYSWTNQTWESNLVENSRKYRLSKPEAFISVKNFTVPVWNSQTQSTKIQISQYRPVHTSEKCHTRCGNIRPDPHTLEYILFDIFLFGEIYDFHHFGIGLTN